MTKAHQMTVGELVRELSTYKKDLPVEFLVEYFGAPHVVASVYTDDGSRVTVDVVPLHEEGR